MTTKKKKINPHILPLQRSDDLFNLGKKKLYLSFHELQLAALCSHLFVAAVNVYLCQWYVGLPAVCSGSKGSGTLSVSPSAVFLPLSGGCGSPGSGPLSV